MLVKIMILTAPIIIIARYLAGLRDNNINLYIIICTHLGREVCTYIPGREGGYYRNRFCMALFYKS